MTHRCGVWCGSRSGGRGCGGGARGVFYFLASNLRTKRDVAFHPDALSHEPKLDIRIWDGSGALWEARMTCWAAVLAACCRLPTTRALAAGVFGILARMARKINPFSTTAQFFVKNSQTPCCAWMRNRATAAQYQHNSLRRSLLFGVHWTHRSANVILHFTSADCFFSHSLLRCCFQAHFAAAALYARTAWRARRIRDASARVSVFVRPFEGARAQKMHSASVSKRLLART